MHKFTFLYSKLFYGKQSHLKIALLASVLVGFFKILFQYLGV